MIMSSSKYMKKNRRGEGKDRKVHQKGKQNIRRRGMSTEIKQGKLRGHGIKS